MAYWSRLAQSQLKHLSHQCRRRCFHTSYASSILHTANNSSASAWGDHLSGATVKPAEFPYNGRLFACSYSQARARKEEDSSGEPRLNGDITGHMVRLVTDSEHKVVSLREALEQAKRMNLDLVESDVKLRKGDCKEVRFTKKIELKDLKMKADSVKRLMERGYRVKLEDTAVVESGPLLEKKQAYAIVRHIKFGPSKKGTKKVKDVNARSTGSSGVSEEDPVETDTEAEDGVLSYEDDDLDEIPVHQPEVVSTAGRAPYSSASNAPRYSDPRLGHGSEAANRISPSTTVPPPSENRYKKPGPANNHFRPPVADNRRPQEGGSFRFERQFPNDRNQQLRPDFNIPPPTGVRRQDPSSPSTPPGTKVPSFGIFSSPKPGGPSEANTNNSGNSSNVGNRYGSTRRF
ncbi:Translation initiation factor IF3-1, mitochondrial [Linum perenne]